MNRKLLLALCLAVACGARSTPSRGERARVAASLSRIDRDTAEAPLLVRWVKESDDNGVLKLRAEVERRTGIRAPITVRIKVPAGASLEGGLTEWSMTDDVSATE